MIFVCVPARFSSSRLPGKLLLSGKESKTVLAEVLSRLDKFVRLLQGEIKVLCFYDDPVFKSCVESEEVEGFLVEDDVECGSSRVALGLSRESLCDPTDLVVMVQGDEPGITLEHLQQLLIQMQDQPGSEYFFNLVNSISVDEKQDQNVVKWDGKSLSRDCLDPALQTQKVLGVYGCMASTFIDIYSKPPSAKELALAIEQQRVLDNSMVFMPVLSNLPLYGINTLEDYRRYLSRNE